MIPTLSLNMIVKNAAPTIERALLSMDPHFDELVIVDTGSTDDTKYVVKKWYVERGANRRFRLLDFTPKSHPHAFMLDVQETYGSKMPGPFTGELCLSDWAAPRQMALEVSTCDFITFLDADDIIQEPKKLRDAIDVMQRNGLDIGLVPYAHRYDKNGNIVSHQLHGRLGFKKNVRWEGRIHETMVSNDATKSTSFSGLTFIDLNDLKNTTERVPNRSLKILYHAWMNGDESPRTLYHLAMEARPLLPDLALDTYALYIEKTKDKGIRVNRSIAHVERGRLLENKEQYAEASAEFVAALDAWMNIPEAALGLARIAFHTRQWEECIDWTHRAFKIAEVPASSLIVYDPTERAARSRVFLALSLANLGRHEEAMAAHDVAKDILPAEFTSLKAILQKKAMSPSPAA